MECRSHPQWKYVLSFGSRPISQILEYLCYILYFTSGRSVPRVKKACGFKVSLSGLFFFELPYHAPRRYPQKLYRSQLALRRFCSFPFSRPFCFSSPFRFVSLPSRKLCIPQLLKLTITCRYNNNKERKKKEHEQGVNAHRNKVQYIILHTQQICSYVCCKAMYGPSKKYLFAASVQ
jgi:hypothetical protein